MNELRLVLHSCLQAQAEPGSDRELDRMLDDRIEAIESRLLELGEARAEMLACIAKAAAA